MMSSSRAPVVHLELHTGALEEARALYRAVCGWRTEAIAVQQQSYDALDLADGLSGGIVACDAPRSLWLPYVAVDSVERATEQARDHGARILLEPREGPAGWRSVMATSAGAEVALWQPKR